MYLLRGIPISRGIAIGKPLIRYDITKRINIYKIEDGQKELEIKKYKNAIEALRNEIDFLIQNSQRKISPENIQLLKYYKLLLDEDFFIKTIIERIEKDGFSADSALAYELEKIKNEFEKLQEEYFKSRFLDFKAIVEKLIRKINGETEIVELETESKVIMVAEEVSPAELLHMKTDTIIGIVTESGSTTSHAAIIAESLGVPAIFGIKDLLTYINKKEDTLIADGYKGIVIVNPDDSTIRDYLHLQNSYKEKEKEILNIVYLPSKTEDDEEIKIYANVSNSMELNIAKRHQAEGIGLLRTELLFIENEKFLEEDEQFNIYKEYLLIFQGKEVVIRTLDMGGDKLLGYESVKEPNPFLGWRSIRVLLKEREKFKQQLRAIIRASVFNDNIKILIPMVSSIEEVLAVKQIYKECESEIKNEGRPLKYDIPIGIMIEIPSAALLSGQLAREVSFFSLGTNDLVQYTLAVDRNNQNVAEYYQPLNPSVLYLMHYTLRNGRINGKPVSVCGEIARNPLYIRLLLGMGIKIFSVNPSYIPLVKSIILKSKLSDCKNLWKTVKTKRTAEEIKSVLKEDLKNNFPEVYESYFYE